MKIRDGFLKARLGGQAYVLPYGQNLADHYRGIALNETGEILWEGLEAGSTREELVHRLQREFQMEDNMAAKLRQDVETFEKNLTDVGILMNDEEKIYGWQPMYFAAGPLSIAYKGPVSVYEQYFKKFACKTTEKADLTIQTFFLPRRYHKNGRVVLRSDEIVLMDAGKEYVFLFPALPLVREMHLKKDGSFALMFCNEDLVDERGEDIFHAIRFALLVAASEKGLFFIHSASFLYNGRAWLFSGKSGTGKSTHTNLWKEAFGVEILNGDLNMLGIQDDTVYVYGQPWCGTSGICTREVYPLGGITFLRQWKKSYCKELKTPEKILAIVQRMFSPAWEKSLLERNISFAERVEAFCPIWQLYCTPDREAAEVMKRKIDGCL